jgi:hypothetical protein
MATLVEVCVRETRDFSPKDWPVVNLIVRIVGYYTLQFCVWAWANRKKRNISSLLVEIEGYFSLEFVNYVCETEDCFFADFVWNNICKGGIGNSTVLKSYTVHYQTKLSTYSIKETQRLLYGCGGSIRPKGPMPLLSATT